MKCKSLLIILFLFTSNIIISQETPDEGISGPEEKVEPFFNHDIGVAYNGNYRIGLSYRHWFDGKLKNFGFQTTLASRSREGGIDLNIYGSFSFLYMLQKSEHVNLFLYQKNSIDYFESGGTRRSGESFLNTYRLYSNSIGFGIEVIALKRLSINLSGGYGVTTYNSNSNPTNERQIGLEAEIGLFYKF